MTSVPWYGVCESGQPALPTCPLCPQLAPLSQAPSVGPLPSSLPASPLLSLSSSPPYQECGIPKHFGLFYAMGTALMMEGLLSACYHVCPNYTNFQFGEWGLPFPWLNLEQGPACVFHHPHVTDRGPQDSDSAAAGPGAHTSKLMENWHLGAFVLICGPFLGKGMCKP